MEEPVSRGVKSLYPRQAAVYRRRWLGLLGFALALLVLSGCDLGGKATVSATPTPIPFVTLNLGLPQSALDAPITGTVPDNQNLHVGVSFKLNLNESGQGSSAKTNSSVSASDIAKQYGITDQQYAEIKQFFGISKANLQLSATRTYMTVDIKAGPLATLLQTRFVTHQLNGRTYYTPDPARPPKVPATIASQIEAVTGLDSYSTSPQKAMNLAVSQSATQQAATKGRANCNDTSGGITTTQMANIYGYNQMWRKGWQGQGLTIDLVEIDGTNPSDLSNYFSCVGYRGKLSYVTVDQVPPRPLPGTGSETTLDIEMIAGMAPRANIVDYQSDPNSDNSGGWTQFNDMLQSIIDDHAKHPNSGDIVSISLGVPEDELTQQVAMATDQKLKIMTDVEHLTVFAASGDCAAFAGGKFGQLTVSFPAADPSVAGVGGTSLNANAQGGRVSEVAWSNSSPSNPCQNSWGTGGGLSTIFTRPSWQQGPGVQNHYSDGKRQVPDISAAADNISTYMDGQWVPVGGTSAATPIWAAGLALVNEGLIQQKGAFVYGPQIFYDVVKDAGRGHPYYNVTQGNNLYYKAGPGWSYPTGWGTPNITGFYAIVYAHIQ